MYSALKIAWHAKTALLIIKSSLSINKIPGDFQEFQEACGFAAANQVVTPTRVTNERVA